MRPNGITDFWSRVSKTETCWPWTGVLASNPYGRFKLKGEFWSPHRLAYTLTYGPIPDGMLVCHRCDNPPCCRPDHLFLGTHADNAHDRDRKGRQIAHPGKANGAARLTEDDVREIRRVYWRGGTTLKTLAAQYGVAFTTIHTIVRRQGWAHLT